LVIDDELPDLLRDDSSASFSDDDSPSWLSDETTFADEDEAEAAPITAQAADDGLVDEDELPDWLREDSTASFADDDSPGWLSDDTTFTDEDEAEAAPIAAQATDDGLVDEDELPDWLREESTTPTQPEPEALSQFETHPDLDMVDEDELPAWLRDTEAEPINFEDELEPTTASEDVPDWLAEEAAETDAADLEPASVPAWLAQEDTADQDYQVPDWLDDDEPLPAETEQPELEPALRGLDPTAQRALQAAQKAFKQGHLADAISNLQTLVEANTALPETVNLLNQAVRQNPNHAPLYEVLGDAQMRTGQLNQALQAYKLALQKM
jgi:hypothetical protein